MQYPPNSISALREPINYDVSEIKEIKQHFLSYSLTCCGESLGRLSGKKKKKNAVLLKLAEQANYLKSSSRF